MRRVVGLKWAKRIAECPWPPRRRSPGGSKAAGLRFERVVAKALGTGMHNPWFEFEDANGIGHCAPDFILSVEGRLVVMECKLTATWDAWDQLQHLYLPVVGLAAGATPIPVEIARAVGPKRVVVDSLAEALRRAEEQPVLHWLGRGRFPWR